MMNSANTQTRPVVFFTVNPRNAGDRHSLQQALSDLAQKDSHIKIGIESDGNLIVSGVSESHLECIRRLIPHDYMIHADVSRPRVIYLETIRRQAMAEGECIYQYGTQNRMYAKVKLKLEPLNEGSGYQFIQEIPDEMIPPEFVGAVDSAIQDAMRVGILAGQEIVDLRAVLCDGSYRCEESSQSAFKIAASVAFKKAVRRANPVILEPIMAVEISGPEEHLTASTLIGDLKSRRGRITGLEHQEKSLLLRAIVPMSEIVGYGSFVRSNTQGHGDCTIQLIRFAEAFPSDPGDDEASVAEPNDPRPDSDTDEAGVPALKPKGPTPKSRSVAANPETEAE